VCRDEGLVAGCLFSHHQVLRNRRTDSLTALASHPRRDP
jgi:hypothetical protein